MVVVVVVLLVTVFYDCVLGTVIVGTVFCLGCS